VSLVRWRTVMKAVRRIGNLLRLIGDLLPS